MLSCMSKDSNPATDTMVPYLFCGTPIPLFFKPLLNRIVSCLFAYGIDKLRYDNAYMHIYVESMKKYKCDFSGRLISGPSYN